MKTVEQSNKVKEEMIVLYNIMNSSLVELKKVALRSEVRRVEHQIYQIKTILENYFDFKQTGGNREIEVACEIIDRNLI